MAELATNIGLTMSMSPGDVEDLRCAALLHDIGKVAVDPAVQNKPGKLTPEEYRHIMIHAQVGPDIVKPLVNEKIVEMIRHHHDRYDGQDPHQTVAGKDIPLGARIIAVADALDAMTTDRYYRRRMSKAHALQEIQECAGS